MYSGKSRQSLGSLRRVLVGETELGFVEEWFEGATEQTFHQAVAIVNESFRQVALLPAQFPIRSFGFGDDSPAHC